MKNPIFIIEGGLGNQLFQLAYAHSSIRGGNKKFGLIFNSKNTQKTSFQLSPILKECRHFSFVQDIGNLMRVFPPLDGSGQLLSKVRGSLFEDWLISREKQYFTYDEKSVFDFKPINRGYFQHTNYVDNSYELFFPELCATIKNIRDQSSISLLDPFTGLHIRRGDYSVQDQGLIHLKYYERILELEESMGNKSIIFGDDEDILLSLSKEFKNSKTFGPSAANAWEVISWLAISNRTYTANSTLSWWGGYLANMNGSKTFLPSPWFLNQEVGDAFVFPGSQLLASSWVT